MAILENKGRRIPLKHSIPLKPRFQRLSLRILSHLASIPLMVPGLLGIAAVFLHAADADLPVLRKQLQAAEDASDKSAIVELSRRIVEADPNDSRTWETLATKQGGGFERQGFQPGAPRARHHRDGKRSNQRDDEHHRHDLEKREAGPAVIAPRSRCRPRCLIRLRGRPSRATISHKEESAPWRDGIGRDGPRDRQAPCPP